MLQKKLFRLSVLSILTTSYTASMDIKQPAMSNQQQSMQNSQSQIAKMQQQNNVKPQVIYQQMPPQNDNIQQNQPQETMGYCEAFCILWCCSAMSGNGAFRSVAQTAVCCLLFTANPNGMNTGDRLSNACVGGVVGAITGLVIGLCIAAIAFYG